MKDLNVNLNTAATVGGLGQTTPSLNTPAGKANAALFKDALGQAAQVAKTQAPSASLPLKFSNHAVDRMQARGVRFSPEQMAKIENAVGRAAEKGSKNCLLLSDEAALIVSVKDKTVVTVMDKTNLKENVFTNIDSTVMI